MSNFSTRTSGHGEGPWEGGAKWVKVKDREEVGKVVDGGKNIGFEHCYGVLFASTGEVCFYRVKDVERCDQSGNTRPLPS